MNENELNEENQVEETEELTDLTVDDSDEVKGGGGDGFGGSFRLNHNESVESDENEAESLFDLEPQDEIKGGPATNTYTGTTTVNGGTLSMNYQRKSGEVQ